jgi:hypothetical protein
VVLVAPFVVLVAPFVVGKVVVGKAAVAWLDLLVVYRLNAVEVCSFVSWFLLLLMTLFNKLYFLFLFFLRNYTKWVNIVGFGTFKYTVPTIVQKKDCK